MHLQTITQHLITSLSCYLVPHIQGTATTLLTFEGLDHAFPHDGETEGDVVFMGAHLTQKLKLQIIQGLKAQQI